jgi:D-arabinose 1-dehydrogenase-like Zn-dependent alcohol dehydrogenase
MQQEENTRKASFMRAIVMERLGGPEVLQLQTRPTPEPGRGQLLVNVITAGVNYMDVGTRTGVNTAAGPLPAVPGVEGVGTVAAFGLPAHSCWGDPESLGLAISCMSPTCASVRSLHFSSLN